MTKHLNYDSTKPYKNRNVEQTKAEFITGVGKVLKEQGFTKLGLREVARTVGYDKKLITLYFGSFENLKTEYLKSINVWDKVFTFVMPNKPKKSDLIDFLKSCYHNLLVTLKEDLEIRNLFIWQINERNPELDKLTDGWNNQVDRFVKLAGPNSELEMRTLLALLYSGVCGAVLNYEKGMFFCEQKENSVSNYHDDLIQTTHLLIEGIVAKYVGVA